MEGIGENCLSFFIVFIQRICEFAMSINDRNERNEKVKNGVHEFDSINGGVFQLSYVIFSERTSNCLVKRIITMLFAAL